MTSNNAAANRAEHGVVSCDMPGYCTHRGSLETTFGAGYASCECENGGKGEASNKVS